ncbi:uncharacterized protein [Asterias amurensis]|uniref:uncharacterized protein n=1 Tax=Asterias amurensis TaxID=7602 RepID=UPI003AB7C266
MDRESNMSQCSSADCTAETSKIFQLQTGSARDSHFKSKSADIFGSLEVMEQKYESETKSFKVVDDDEGGDKEERRFIERGCIFKKPVRSEYDTLSGKDDLKTNQDRDVHGHHSSLVSKSHSLGTEAKQSIRSTQDTKTIFRKPCTHPKSKESKEETTTNRPPDWSRGQRQGAWNRRPRGGRRQPPDHFVNPEKYTKYSLEETNMCGNAANRSVALGFLNDLKKRKEEESTSSIETEVCEDGKHVFQKPVLSKESTEQSPKRKVYGSVYKMADYEVGMSSSVQKPKKLKLMDSLKQKIDDHVLDHLSDNTVTRINQSEDSFTQEESMSNQSEQDKESRFKSRKFKQRKRLRERTDDS